MTPVSLLEAEGEEVVVAVMVRGEEVEEVEEEVEEAEEARRRRAKPYHNRIDAEVFH